MPIILPTAPVKPTKVNPSVLVLYGPPKVGKTTLLAKLPGCLLIDVEDGSDYVEALKIKAANPVEFREICAELINKGKPYKYVAVDTIDAIEDWCEREATVAYKATNMGKTFTGSSVLELPMGAGYFWLRQSFNRYLEILTRVAPYIILIGHVRDSVLQTTGNQEVQAKSLDLTGKIRNIVCSWADAIGYMTRNNDGQITINFKTRELINCGGRCEHLLGKEMQFTSWDQIYKPE